MSHQFRLSEVSLYNSELYKLENRKLIVNTLNAHSFNIANRNADFAKALRIGDILLPDGVSIVWAAKVLYGIKLKKIAGADLFLYEMKRLQESGGSCFFLGSTQNILDRIKTRVELEFPLVKGFFYSPPFREKLTPEEDLLIRSKINEVKPDVLFIGMTAPKQELWAMRNSAELTCGHICSIGAVFDFYAGTIKRAPKWMISIGLEWLYRLIMEPGRMWKRYLVGNTLFVFSILIEKIKQKKEP